MTKPLLKLVLPVLLLLLLLLRVIAEESGGRNCSSSSHAGADVELLYFAPSFLGLTGISENAVHTVASLEELLHGGKARSWTLGAVSETPSSTRSFRSAFRPLPWADVVGKATFERVLSAESRGETLIRRRLGASAGQPPCVPRPEISEERAGALMRIRGGEHTAAILDGRLASTKLDIPLASSFRVCIFHGTPHERLVNPAGVLSVAAALNTSLSGCGCDYTIARIVMEASLENETGGEGEPSTDTSPMRGGIPGHWRLFLSQFDEIWLPSRFTAPGLLQSGGRDVLRGVRTFVVPEPIPAAPLGHGETRRQLRVDGQRRLREKHGIDTGNSVVFLSVFAFCRRKAPFKLIKAFLEAFTTPLGQLTTTKRPVLVIKSGSQPNLGGSDLSWLRDLVGAMVASHRSACGAGWLPEVVVYRGDSDDGVLSRREYEALLHAADTFVLPSRAEGFCRPCAEAMASGAVAIVTGAGGQREFMSANNSLLIEFAVGPVPHDILFSSPGEGGGGGGGSGGGLGGDVWSRQYEFMKWADPDDTHLRQLFRRVFDALSGVRLEGDAKELLTLAARGAKEVIQSCSHASVAELIVRRVQEAIVHHGTRDAAGKREQQQEAAIAGTALLSHSMLLWNDALDSANGILPREPSIEHRKQIEQSFQGSLRLLDDLCVFLRPFPSLDVCGGGSSGLFLKSQVQSDYTEFLRRVGA